MRWMIRIALAIAFATAARGEAQPPCQPADLQLTPAFVNGPGTFTVVIQAKNTGTHVCNFNSPFGPVGQSAPNNPSGHVDFKHVVRSSGILVAGGTGTFAYSWKTTPVEGSGPCVAVQWIDSAIVIAAPSLLQPLCSDVDFREIPDLPAQPEPTLELVAPKETFVESEQFDLQASRRPGVAPLDGEPITLSSSSPRPQQLPFSIYVLQRSAKGTRLDEMRAWVAPCFGSHTQPCLQFGPLATSTGITEFRLYEKIEPAKGGMQFRASETLQVRGIAPFSIQRAWNGSAAGLAVDLTLDKTVYVSGERIPLHIALENVSADAPVHGWSPSWDPGDAISLALLDEAGKVVASDRMDESFGTMSGHGFGPSEQFDKGRLVPIERTYYGSWHPVEPGAYTFVVKWSPLIGSATEGTEVEARANVTITP